MKKVIAGIVMAFMLSSCGQADTDTTTAPESTPVPSVSPSLSADELYIDMMKEELPQFPNPDEAGLIEAGKGVCDYFEENGVSLLNLGILTNEFLAQGFTNDETAAIFVISTTAYCPDVKDDLLALGGTSA